MLQDLRKIIGCKLGASDGDIGHVKDFYFDDLSWMVRYLVADTGNWLTGRQVLLTPESFGHLPFGKSPEHGDVLRVTLSRKMIEDSPSIDTHRPVSRQQEEAYYRYYGWPVYWPADAIGGIWMGTPEMPMPQPLTPPPAETGESRADIHLRSVREVTGYSLRASDGEIGSVSGFVVDEKTWKIREIVVDIGHWFSGKEVNVSTDKIASISYDDSCLFADLSKAEIEAMPRNDVNGTGV